MGFVYPYPEDSDVDPIVVPYYPSPQYDHTAPEAFPKFPQRNGFTASQDSSKLDTNRSPDQLAALMQSWLYFGLIDEILGSHTNRSAFFVSAETLKSQQLACDSIDIRVHNFLDEQLALYQELENERKKTIQETRSEYIHRCLSHAFKKCSEFEAIDVPADSALPPVCLSVRLLLLHLQRRFKHLSLKLSASTPLSSTTSTPLVQMLLERGRTSGICMRTLYSNGLAFDHATLYYLTSLKRRSDANQHHTCTKTYCQVGDALRADPKAHHRQDGCPCLKRSPPIEKIVKLIRKGDIPLISMTRDAIGCIQLNVVKCAVDTPYVAISHVWSDDQLCSESNGLYQCQLEWLADSISRIPQNSRRSALYLGLSKRQRPKSQLFWLDTLCVPIGDTYIKVKQQAIDQMDLVYAGASKVLVLDSELQKIYVGKQEITVPRRHRATSSWWLDITEVPAEKDLLMVAAYIFRSNWMSRAWTLQEGYLARDCVLQLSDASVEIGHLDPWVYKRSANLQPYAGLSPWFFWCCDFYSGIRSFFCRPYRVTQRNILLRALDGAHAGIVIALSLLVNMLIWPLLMWNGEFDYEVQIKQRGGVRSTIDSLDEYDSICNSVCNEVRGAVDQLSAFSSDSSHEQRFQRAWKALLSRSTTKTEDLHAILANLTGFSPKEILQHENVGERMRNILYMFTKLPLDILYIEGEKYSSRSDSADQWMPIWPCDRALTSRSAMISNVDGYFMSMRTTDQLYAIEGEVINSCKFEALEWNAPPAEDETDSAAWVEILDVTCLGADEESITNLAAKKEDRKHYLLIERTEGATSTPRSIERGALLHSVRKDGNKLYLQYICSVRIHRRFQEITSTTSGRFMRKPESTDEVYLQRDYAQENRPTVSRRLINPRIELENAALISMILAVQLYFCATWLISVLAFGLRRRLSPHITRYAPGYTVCVVLYLLFALCVVLPASQWAINIFLSRGVLNAWKSSFYSGERPRGRLSFWGFLHRCYLGSRKFMHTSGQQLHPRVKRYGINILITLTLALIIFELIIAPIMILGYMARNTKRWVTHNTSPKIRMPFPVLPDGHCWSEDGQQCLYNGFVLHSVPAANDTACWSWDGKDCSKGTWDGSASPARSKGWWNGTTTKILISNGTDIVTTLKDTDD